MKVELIYFKKSGKYYADGEYTTKLTVDDGLYKVWDEIEDMFRREKRPGLVDGRQEFTTLVSVPEHPHDHPHLIMPQE
jgi:hypothetical protein